MGAGDVLTCRAGTIHKARDQADCPAALLICFSNASREFVLAT
jgi:hypothetical protein